MYNIYSSHYCCSQYIYMYVYNTRTHIYTHIYIYIYMRQQMNDFWLRLEEFQHLGQGLRLSCPRRASALLQTTDEQPCRNPSRQQLLSTFCSGAFINKWFNSQRTNKNINGLPVRYNFGYIVFETKFMTLQQHQDDVFWLKTLER